MTDLFIVAGEASGDFHGARLVRALKEQRSDLHIAGVSGPRMRAEGVEDVLGIEDLAIMGFTDVLRALPRLRHQIQSLIELIIARQPKMVVLIDYAGLNLRVAKGLRNRGFDGKIIQYISPKVWAWGRHRIRTLAAHFDLLLSIFPFEADHFRDSGLQVEYVGNPLTEEKQGYRYATGWKESQGIPADAPIVGLFPGSRASEIRLNTAKQLRAALHLREKMPHVQFVLSVASEAVKPRLLEICQQEKVDFPLIPSADTYNLMANCQAAIATSGTVNLELALHRVPHVVVYGVTHLNAFVARCIFGVKLPHYSIANFVHGTTFLPELIYVNFTPKRTALRLQELLQNSEQRDACLTGCDRVCQLLESTAPSTKAADLLLAMHL